MIDITQDIQPLTTFRNNSVEFMQQLKATQRPIIHSDLAAEWFQESQRKPSNTHSG